MTSRSLMAEPSIKPSIVVREDLLKSQELSLATKRAVQAKEYILAIDDEKMEEFIAFAHKWALLLLEIINHCASDKNYMSSTQRERLWSFLTE